MLWTSVCVSSSHNSMWEEATRISCGPSRVPGTYDVVRSSGTGRMTTRAFSKSVEVGLVPPNSPGVTESYSNGRLIHVLEAIGGYDLAVDRHHTRRQGERRHPAPGKNGRGGAREGGREDRQCDRRVGLH